MKNHVKNRDDVIVKELHEELVGPAPAGQELDLSSPPIQFDKKEEAYGAWREKETGEEILTRDGPRVRYGVGVLHPHRIAKQEEEDLLPDDTILLKGNDKVLAEKQEQISDQALRKLEAMKDSTGGGLDDDFELSAANAYHQSAMAVSFLLETQRQGNLTVTVTGGRYEQFVVWVAGQRQIWWRRIPVRLVAILKVQDILNKKKHRIDTFEAKEGFGQLTLNIELFFRDTDTSSHTLVTVALTNRTVIDENYEQRCLFQSYFDIKAVGVGNSGLIHPYPNTRRSLDDEEKSLELLYRNLKTFAVGHGCAADWEIDPSQTTATMIKALAFPTFELPSITADIERDAPKGRLEVPMLLLSDPAKRIEAINLLKELISEYREWIEERSKEIIDAIFPDQHQDAARRHIVACTECADRMAIGISLLESDEDIYTAFRLANEAVLLQQIQSKQGVRTATFNDESMSLELSRPYTEPDVTHLESGRGKWRPFQIGFLLLSLAGTSDCSHVDRDIVDLIWFPTGGGKTEAYLGLAAFSIFYSRLVNSANQGVNVLMRYTLRLLTAQQFQRASSLICAMESIRRQKPDLLGSQEISIGIWLGGDVTPNSNRDAASDLNRLAVRQYAKNPFLLVKCPWCACEMGKYSGRSSQNAPRIKGYRLVSKEVILHCPDPHCIFYRRLPVYVTDEQLYAKRPSFVIATVDKFAGVAWNGSARALFGIGNDGARISPPPNLIIQDELHLISGPLGSVFGLYETLIEDLCSAESNGRKQKPKIIASTATIRRFAKQIRDLYSRSDSRLFPPPGIEAGDSFFARYARDGAGKLKSGRRYVGIFAANLGSLQTAEQRTYSSLMQAPMSLPDACQRDPWWTLLLFFNSLRELGTSLSLLQSDIPTYLKAIKNRKGISPLEIRRVNNPRELTSRLKNDEVSRALEELSIPCDMRSCVDVCLASNIIEVGVDIDRLGLMAVVGQPKSTSQYIQVTGRVGRQVPGLVVTIYAVSKPRDRSHFEKFRTYHERLYAQVEPTSVTPFSTAVLERALHAVLVGYVRQKGSKNVVKRPSPFPESLLEEMTDLLRERVEIVDIDQIKEVERMIELRLRQWKKWCPHDWDSRVSDITPLLREAGTYTPIHWKFLTWSTQRSMRNVDHEC